MSRHAPSARAGSQRGLSLVELLVGVAVGLFVVAAAAMLAAMQLSDNRRLQVETQVQQDLRAATDIIVRDLRRAGTFQGLPIASAGLIWRPGDTVSAQANTSLLIEPDVNGTPSNVVVYRSGRNTGGFGPYGFRLLPESTTIESLYLGASGPVWQALTDPTTMKVTRFEVTARNEPPIKLVCPKACPAPAPQYDSCWPTVTVRSYRVEIDAESLDRSVQRRVDEVVRPRTEAVNQDPDDSLARCPT